MVLVELAGQCQDEGFPLGLRLALGELRELLRISYSGDQRIVHHAPGEAEDVLDDRRQFDGSSNLGGAEVSAGSAGDDAACA
ncbi:hypothetical protein [Streptomyces sp. NPDC001315]|uniref:hypothetical protein n=1 Tax=Streptomyces sp. NPDC001315 TaxID=3364562 RepID=UPI0036A91016